MYQVRRGQKKGEIGGEQGESVDSREISQWYITKGPHVPEVIAGRWRREPRISLFSTLEVRIGRRWANFEAAAYGAAIYCTIFTVEGL